MKKLLILIVFLMSNILIANAAEYKYEPAGVSFDYGELKIDKSSRRETPFSEVFSFGSEPFSVSVLFKKVQYDGSLKDFIETQKNEHKKGGYSDEVTITQIESNGELAYEIIRESGSLKIRWFVFGSKKNNKLYSFWFAEAPMLKEENMKAITAYETMKSSLELVK